MEMTMLRKLSLAAFAAVSLGAAALAPTSASAWVGPHGGWHGGGWHAGWHGGWRGGGWGWRGAPRFYVGGPGYYGYGGCYARRVVPTPWGPRWRVVNRCY
jgi:hypothetical protein